jgi:hypothetical protein
MMRYLALLLLMMPACVHAQPGADTMVPRLTFKTNVTTLINPFKEAYAFTSDIRLTRRSSIDVGAGAYFHSTYFITNPHESYKGLRLRTGIKYFPQPNAIDPFYVGLEGMYNNVRNNIILNVYRQGRQYREFLPVTRKVISSGWAVRLGYIAYWGKKKRFFIDQYCGVGILFTNVTRPVPADAEIVKETKSYEYPEGRNRYLDILMGVHLGVALW